MNDFFISYNDKDRPWAEWIAWILEDKGYSVVVKAWDFQPGHNLVLATQEAVRNTRQTIIVLSEHYINSTLTQADYTQAEWAAVFSQDPQGNQLKLIPIRVDNCKAFGLLRNIIYIDCINILEETAKYRILKTITSSNPLNPLKKQRLKPLSKPPYPTDINNYKTSKTDKFYQCFNEKRSRKMSLKTYLRSLLFYKKIRWILLVFTISIGMTLYLLTNHQTLPSKTLYISYTEDAPPISSSRYGQVFSGYCADLKKYLNNNSKYEFKEVKVDYADRFKREAHVSSQKISDSKIAIECGANTITEIRKKQIYQKEGGAFSDAFAQTGAKVLIRKSLYFKIQEADHGRFRLPLQNQIIGILGKTTTNSLLHQILTGSTVKQYTHRSQAINDLNQGKLSIYSSDALLLEHMWKKSLENKDEYMIIPNNLLSHENYGIVVYDSYKDYENNDFNSDYRENRERDQSFDGRNAEILKLVNTWIGSKSGQKSYQNRIQPLLDEAAQRETRECENSKCNWPESMATSRDSKA